ncbi:flagellar assembly protein FliW [Paenibacillus cremeus]|uniref:Flagellar assembly factor FliW n=1 Tax=Paenibacillus cremeus TaxID=2163881 RepID=A0A559KB32_9BACL|nr:flagellar assembly protein FliW [Paenibacillus cremeus]TVY09335.1 flagellar assembly protein FliW [Paenibacillus cremeus]
MSIYSFLFYLEEWGWAKTMATINTSRFGEVQTEQGVISFPQGIPGFEDEHQFVIYQPDADSPLSYLQSIHNENLSFIITDPFLFYKEYEFDLSAADQDELNLADNPPLSVWSIITVSEDIQQATLNLLAPIIINMREKIGKQVILQNSPYKTKHKLLGEEQSK